MQDEEHRTMGRDTDSIEKSLLPQRNVVSSGCCRKRNKISNKKKKDESEARMRGVNSRLSCSSVVSVMNNATADSALFVPSVQHDSLGRIWDRKTENHLVLHRSGTCRTNDSQRDSIARSWMTPKRKSDPRMIRFWPDAS